MEQSHWNAVVEIIKNKKTLCKCGKSTMHWYTFEYTHDLIGWLEGEDTYTWCCPEEEE